MMVLFSRTQSSFHYQVYALVQRIPKGRVTTYAAVSRALCGSPVASRAVGCALHRNPTPLVVPCHRVVRSDGSLGGYVYGVRQKGQLLRREGVEVVRGRVSLQQYGLSPCFLRRR